MFVTSICVWCGNMNLLNGLLPIRHIILDYLNEDQGQRGALGKVNEGIREAFRFLTSTSGYVTKGPAFVSTHRGASIASEMSSPRSLDNTLATAAGPA